MAIVAVCETIGKGYIWRSRA